MTPSKKKIPLFLQIILGMGAGIAFGLLAPLFDNGIYITENYLKPFGIIFIRLLKMMAIPLILSSLIVAVAQLKDTAKVTRIGGRTLLLFLSTALISTTVGVVLANIIQPGKFLPQETRTELLQKFGKGADNAVSNYSTQITGPLSPIIEMVPDNIFSAASDNGLMLQIVVFALIFGLALSKTDYSKTGIILQFFEGINEILLKMVMMIMVVAPFGVFALLASFITDLAGHQIGHVLLSLLTYIVTVLIGLLFIFLILYPVIIRVFSKVKYFEFFREMRPAFALAFSTSSSAATLPVTMERVEKHLKVSPEITGFVLPFGTTINMDGTALYQCVATIFISQAFGLDLTIFQQLGIIFAATLGAAGAAGIPGAGLITLVMVLQVAGVPPAGIALILPPDRILDMCRTVVNVAGDATAALAISGFEKKHNSE